MIRKTILGATTALLLSTGASAAGEITIGMAPNLQTLPVVVAMSEGYFAEENIDLETVRFTSGRRALEALIGGQLDVAFMAEYPVSIASLREQRFWHLHHALPLHGKSHDIQGIDWLYDPSSLSGKKIGTTKGSNTEFFTGSPYRKVWR